VVALVASFLSSPEYWSQRGFPLDDAWIHAVYARSVALGDGLAYNPGIPATGETSPLWALVLAPLHLGTPTPGQFVLRVKLFGVVLHVLGAAAAYLVLRRAGQAWALCAAACTLLHPDLLAASGSGMEVPLAVLGAWGLVLGMEAPRRGVFALACAVLPLGRPEIALFAGVLPLLLRDGRGVRWLVGRWVEASAGLGVGFGAWALWNLHASGRPLPATFYAKVEPPGGNLLGQLWDGLRVGFGELLPLVSVPLLLVALVLALGLWAVLRTPSASAARCAAGLAVAGLAYCATTFVLLRMGAGDSFYAQRYALPGVPFVVAALPPLLGAALTPFLSEARRTRVLTGLAVALPIVFALGIPVRMQRLENDAHNIDDAQVAEGRSLAGVPPGRNVWALDAGAIRYFGNAFVVDLVGLNTPQMLGPEAQAFLDAHPPSYLEWVPGWAAIRHSVREGIAVHGQYEPSTEYTITSRQEMKLRVLYACLSGEGKYIGMKVYPYRCAEAPAGERTP
jgi:hypothetical protein